MSGPIPLRKYDQHGDLALRDGLNLVLFTRASHEQVCTQAAALYERYLALVGPEILAWAHSRSSSFRPFTTRKQNRIRKLLTPEMAAAAKDELFTLKSGGESEVPAHRFQYMGEDMQRPLAEDSNNSYIEIWFPSEFPATMGYPAFVQAMVELANCIPVSSGYCSLAFNYEDWAEMAAVPIVRGLAKRHPGMDVHSTLTTATDMDDGPRGAYWLTILGLGALARLEMDAATLRDALGDGIEVHELAHGVVIQAGPEPTPGDVNRRDRLPLVRRVAQLIEPVQVIPTHGIFVFDDEDEWIAWHRRHLL